MGGLTREFERAFLGERSPPVGERFASGALHVRDAQADCPTCGVPIGPGEVTDDARGVPHCATCRDSRLAWNAFIRLAAHDGAWRDAIHETKFSRHRRLGHAIGARLGERIHERLREAGIEPERAIICPMPTTLRRRLARGIDHAGVLSRGAAWSAGLRVAPLLSRTHRPSQLDVPASQRARNIAGAFRARPGAIARTLGRMGQGACVVIVIDDVRTTGATMRGACRALRAGVRRACGGESPERDPRGVQVWAAVVATADRGDEGSPENEAGPENDS